MIGWGISELALPTMPDDAFDGGKNVGGATVAVAGITGAIRGRYHTLSDGRVVRPDLAILDDPQTRESAESATQTASRLSIVNGDVMGLGGPGKTITAVLPCTVIQDGDLADQLLNRDLNPQWRGQKTQFVLSWPTNDDLWEQYHSIRDDELSQGKDHPVDATEFYHKNRIAMDVGGRTSWPARKGEHELSAIQHAQNLRRDMGEEAFAAEYQNEPFRDGAEGVRMLTADEITQKMNRVERLIVPAAADHLTAFIDVHDEVLYYAVCAWSGEFDGWVVDYGTYPEQRRRHFTLAKAPKKLSMIYPDVGSEGAIRQGLDMLSEKLLTAEWKRDDGTPIDIEKLLVDAGYETDLVHTFCRYGGHGAITMPARGLGIGASGRPISEYKKRIGDKFGWHWYIQAPTAKSANKGHGRYIRFDANHWKTFVHARFVVDLADKGSLSLFGEDRRVHKLFSEHMTAELPDQISAENTGRTVNEWKIRPGRSDNHWFDCIVGCSVAASLVGAKLEVAQPKARKRVRVSMAEKQRLRRAVR